MKIRHALIMAAGRGIRMRPLTDTLPKAMAPYNGTTLIAEGIGRIGTTIENIHVTVGHHKAMLAAHVIQHGAATVINTEGRGNCWWLYNTFLSLLDEPIVVLTCDNAAELDFALLDQEYARQGNPPCMLVPIAPVEGVEGDYLFVNDGFVVGVSRLERSNIYSSGIQVLNPVRVRELTESVEDFGALWAQLIPGGHLRASQVYPDSWQSFDTLDQLRASGSTV